MNTKILYQLNKSLKKFVSLAIYNNKKIITYFYNKK